MKYIALLTIVLCSSEVFSQNIEIQKIDSLVSHIENNDRGIGSISIFKDGDEIYNRSFGQVNLQDIQFNSETKYQVGSITKIITATLIFQLIETNYLRLDDKLSDFFPNIPNSENIKITNLLSHTSGLRDFTVKNDSLSWLTKKVTKKEIFSEIIKQGVLFQPNDEVAYSNSGYYLLTKIIEKLYQKDYATIVAEMISQPLDLKNFKSITPYIKNIHPSYSYDQGWVKITDFEFSNIIGVGDIASTTTDLNKFLYNLFRYKIVSKESVELMKPDTTKEETFGRGLMLAPFYEIISYGHGGDTYGTHSAVFYNEENKIGLAYSINGERFPHNDFAIWILSIIYQREYEFPSFKTITLRSEDLDIFLGTYSSPDFPIKLTISKEGNILKGQATGQSSFQLEAYDRNIFKFELAGLKLEFFPDETIMLLHQNGIIFEMKKE